MHKLLLVYLKCQRHGAEIIYFSGNGAPLTQAMTHSFNHIPSNYCHLYRPIMLIVMVHVNKGLQLCHSVQYVSKWKEWDMQHRSIISVIWRWQLWAQTAVCELCTDALAVLTSPKINLPRGWHYAIVLDTRHSSTDCSLSVCVSLIGSDLLLSALGKRANANQLLFHSYVYIRFYATAWQGYNDEPTDYDVGKASTI